MRIPVIFAVDDLLLPYASTSLKLRDARRGLLDHVAATGEGRVFVTDSEARVGTVGRLARIQPQGEEGVYIGSVVGEERGRLVKRFVHEEYRIEFGEVALFDAPTEDERAAAADFVRWLDACLLQVPEALAEIAGTAARLRDADDPLATLYRVAALFLRAPLVRKEFLLLPEVDEQVGYLLQVVRRALLTGEVSGGPLRLSGVERTH